MIQFDQLLQQIKQFKNYSLYINSINNNLIYYLAKKLNLKLTNPLKDTETPEQTLAIDEKYTFYQGNLAKIYISLWQKTFRDLLLDSQNFKPANKLFIPAKFSTTLDIDNPKKSLESNLLIYQNTANYILFNFIPRTVEEVVQVLDFSEFSDPQNIDYFLQKSELSLQLFSSKTIFAPCKAWLIMQGPISKNAQLGFQNCLWKVVKEQLDSLFLQYKYLLQQLTFDQQFQMYIQEGEYVISSHQVFKRIQQFIHKLFKNVCTLEDLEKLNQKIEPLNERFRIQEFFPFEAQQSQKLKIGQTQRSYKNEQFKLQIAKSVFFKAISYIISQFHELDLQDQLLLQIDKLRSEQLAIIQEQNLEQNEILQQTVYQDKLSLIFQPILAQYVDLYYDQLTDDLLKNSQYISIIIGVSQKISNFQRVCPQLDKFILRQNSSNRTPDDERVIVPAFCFVQLKETVPNNFYIFYDDVKNKTIDINFESDHYTLNQSAMFIGTILIHGRRLNKTLNSPEIKYALDIILPKLARSKQKLLKFLISPQSFNYFSVKEEVAKTRQIRPIEDIYAQEKSPIKEVIQNMVIYLLNMSTDSVFFKIAEDYSLMKEFQAAGVTELIGGVFHYDCLIKDYITGDSLHFSVKKLSVVAFRFFIIIYCSLIFISSLIFNNYKMHGEYCTILSNFSVLEQDRFIYLISQISNSLNVICNVKGFTEYGAVGYINSMYELFFSQINDQALPQTLEQLIMQCDFDQAILLVCQNFQQKENIQAKDEQDEDTNEGLIQFQLNSNQVSRFEAGLENNVEMLEDIVSKLKKKNRRDNIFTGEKLFYQFQEKQKIDRFLVYSEKHAKMTDFIRTHARSLQKLCCLSYMTLTIRNNLLDKYNNQIYNFECLTEQCMKDEINFINFYNENVQYLYIRNECQIDQFPPITPDLALYQLVQINKIDDKTSILDEIINNFCWLTQQINTSAKTTEINIDILTSIIQNIGQSFSDMVSTCQNLQSIHSILATLKPLKFTPQPLMCKQISVIQSNQYYEILTLNSQIITQIPDFKSSKEVFNRISSLKPQSELQELSEQIVILALDGEKIDLTAQLASYFKDVFDYQFDGVEGFNLADCLLFAAFSEFDK
ncbi:hypothetical protein SS50377_22288 [Spironucleus salmonicida]|uniref:Uncharacterized protein n=1 Tax=Spironucleus salmonicida TaxID=348837 RepID=V6LDA8_9EUKA|nr:hypothetical protein SS50377_22288 [Spironucleus salmonicida]|eukprot:EST42218.1 Hypothetical protein SS50377_18520 [Spironucleus salmonicida]